MRMPRLSYANVMATVAVFLALGGGAYALTLGKNSVKRKNIASGAVSTKKLAKDAVTGAKANESSFGTVPNAAKLGGTAPGGFVAGLNSIERVHNEVVPLNGAGVVFTISGVGTIQFKNCKTPSVSLPLGGVNFVNTSTQTEDVWATIYGDDTGGPTPHVEAFTEQPNPFITPVFLPPNDALAGRVDVQVGSRGTPSKVTVASLVASYDSAPTPDVCRYSLWTSKTEEEQG